MKFDKAPSISSQEGFMWLKLYLGYEIIVLPAIPQHYLSHLMEISI